MRLCKIFFSHPSLVIYFLPNLTYTTKTERADRWETTKSKPPRLANQNHGAQSNPIYYTLLWQVLRATLDEGPRSKDQ
jgi:hypothetical protein